MLLKENRGEKGDREQERCGMDKKGDTEMKKKKRDGRERGKKQEVHSRRSDMMRDDRKRQTCALIERRERRLWCCMEYIFIVESDDYFLVLWII